MSGKKLILLCLALVLVVVVGCSKEVKTIGVNALAADPAAFKGEIAVKGVVQAVDLENATMTIIDEQEYITCGLNPCGGAGIIPLYLPDSGKAKTPAGNVYKGDLPQIEETVTVIGKIISVQQGYFFDVERVMKGSQTIISKDKV